MVHDRSELDDIFHALSDPTRRAMIEGLSGEQKTVGELARPFAMSVTAAAKHVKVLERAGLVRRRVQGRTHICRLEPTPIVRAIDWMRAYEQFWSARLDALAEMLGEDEQASGSETP